MPIYDCPRSFLLEVENGRVGFGWVMSGHERVIGFGLNHHLYLLHYSRNDYRLPKENMNSRGLEVDWCFLASLCL